jgi:hypothetical protein
MTSEGQTCIRAIALTATKVAFVYRQGTAFRLMRLNVVGNSLDQASVANFDLSGATSFNSTTAFAFDVAPVRDDPNKVVVGGSNGTNWSLQAFNIPDSGTLTTASSLFNTSLAHTAFHFAMAPLTKTVAATTTTYIVAANTSTGVTLSVQNFTFNSATNGFAAAGTPVTVTNSTTVGISARCLSTGAAANAVVAYINTGSAQAMQFLVQTNAAQAANTVTSATLSSATGARALKTAFSWGDQRAVFLADINGLVVHDSAGNRTALVSSTDSTTTSSSQPLWYPFNSRPLYTYYDDTTQVGKLSQFLSRTGMSSPTSLGVATLGGNYFPHGHPYGGAEAWSPRAGCWFIGQGGKVYAVSGDGVVLNELSLYSVVPAVAGNAFALSVKQLGVLASGALVMTTDRQGTSAGAGYYGIYWGFISPISYGIAIAPVLSPAALTSAAVLSAVNFGYHVAVDMATYTDSSNNSRALALFVNSATNMLVAATQFNGTSWSVLGNTSISAGPINSAFNFGARPNFALVQDSPVNAVNPTGLWRVIGAFGLNAAVNMGGFGISGTAVSADSITTTSVNQTINSTNLSVYPVVKCNSSAQNVVYAMYDTLRLQARAYFVVGGRLVNGLFGTGIDTPSSMQVMNVSSVRYGFVVAPCNSGTGALAQTAYVFDAVNPLLAPRFTLAATSGNGWTTLNRYTDTDLGVFAAGVNTRYVVSGANTSQFNIFISGGGSDYSVLPVNGQAIETSTASAYRNSSVYLIPNNYSVRIRSSLSGSLSAMLTIVEDA